MAFSGDLACGQLSGKRETQEGPERDAGQNDALRVDARAASREADRLLDGGQPLRRVCAIANGREVGADCACAVEVVRRVERDARLLQEWAKAARPEVEIAARTMQKHDGRMRLSGARCDLLGVDADGALIDDELKMSGHVQ